MTAKIAESLYSTLRRTVFAELRNNNTEWEGTILTVSVVGRYSCKEMLCFDLKIAPSKVKKSLRKRRKLSNQFSRLFHLYVVQNNLDLLKNSYLLLFFNSLFDISPTLLLQWSDREIPYSTCRRWLYLTRSQFFFSWIRRSLRYHLTHLWTGDLSPCISTGFWEMTKIFSTWITLGYVLVASSIFATPVCQYAKLSASGKFSRSFVNSFTTLRHYFGFDFRYLILPYN